MKTRFAPSPTGFLHIGNARTALLCYLYARKEGGTFLLRIDDTDTERSKQEYTDAIKRDLEWLGLEWDELEHQSSRFDRYNEAVEKLKADGRLYPCYETTQELDVKRKMQLSRGKPPLYDRAALKLTDEEKAAFDKEGRVPHWRFKLNDESVIWEDEIRGRTEFSGQFASDPILIRENGAYTYMLPSTVDDIDMNITHVLRGEDHVSNTAVQIQMFQALDGDVPSFAHNALIKGKEGKLSKRKGGNSLAELRDEGIEPMAINSLLAKVGTSDPIEIRSDLAQLVDEFDIHKFGKNQTFYDADDLDRLTEKLLHELSYEQVKEKINAPIDEAFWQAVQGNITRLGEVATWYALCHEPLTPIIDDAEFLSQAAELLPEGEWGEGTWSEWTNAVKDKTGRKGKELFMPIRKALTAMDHGPELKALLPLIGRNTALKRLQGEAA